MPIEKTILPDFIVAQIYGSNLVIGNDLPKSIPKPIIPNHTAKAGLNYLGNNGKQISILVKEAEMPFINDQDLQFLTNILSACKLNMGDVAIMNTRNRLVAFDQLKEDTKPKFLIAFDLSPKEINLPFTIPHYQVQAYDQCQFLFAPALSVMDGLLPEAKAEKTKLWASLKRIFQL